MSKDSYGRMPGDAGYDAWSASRDKNGNEKFDKALELLEQHFTLRPKSAPKQEEAAPEPKEPTPNQGAQFKHMHHHDGVTYTFTEDEMYNAKDQNYMSNALNAKDMGEEEGKSYNRRMRALSDYAGKFKGLIGNEDVTTHHLHNQAKGISDGQPIKVGELRHTAPASRRDDIAKQGITPKVTDKVGSEKFTSKRFGVFLANDYTSSEGGYGGDVYRVNVPHHELKVDSEYTPHGQNLYIERTIKPHELEHIGHFGESSHDLHPGLHEKCDTCADYASKKQEFYRKKL